MRTTQKIVYAQCPYCFCVAKVDNYWIIEPIDCGTSTVSIQTIEKPEKESEKRTPIYSRG